MVVVVMLMVGMRIVVAFVIIRAIVAGPAFQAQDELRIDVSSGNRKHNGPWPEQGLEALMHGLHGL